MDLTNFAATPQLDNVQRHPSLSSLSSTSGYASSGYGSNPTNHINNHRMTQAPKPSNTSNPSLQNFWINGGDSPSSHTPSGGVANDVAPWVEQQKQQQSKVGSLADANLGDLKKEKGVKKTDPKPNGQAGSGTTVTTNANANSGNNSSNSNQNANNSSNNNSNNNSSNNNSNSNNSNSNNNSNNNSSNNPNNSSNDDDDIDDDDLIPTAIVIKNIPFAIKKEQLLDVMTKLNLPLPYAFNYHFDNGVFRGLAFANFTSTNETSLVVNQLNGREIGGRKLRVEYKKMLPALERERIEREKREKRGQLEEQHRSSSNASLASLMSGTSTTAATKNLSVNGGTAGANQTERVLLNYPSGPNLSVSQTLPPDINFNDAEVLELYAQLVVFRDDVSKAIFELAFPPNLNLNQRKILTTLCTYLNLLELYDNGLVIIRRKPGQVVSLLNTNDQPTHSSSMMNLNQLNGPAPGASPTGTHVGATGQNSNLLGQTSTHPELLRSHSQSALHLPRLRQQQNTTPIQQFSQYLPNGNGSASGSGPETNVGGTSGSGSGSGSAHGTPAHGSSIPLYTPNMPPFGIYQQNPGPQLLSNPSMVQSSSAAAILRNNSNGSRPYGGDIRSTPPLSNSFIQPSGTDSPTPITLQPQPQLATGTGSASGSKAGSNPSTPLPTNDINSRFAPFGQHNQLPGSFTSLSGGGNKPGSRQSDDLTSKFSNITLANGYDNNNSNGPSAPVAAGNSSSGIWGPK